MSERTVERRLAAILAADVAGYTVLMEDDTDGPLPPGRMPAKT
jgi:class 3 adenylate cyclase